MIRYVITSVSAVGVGVLLGAYLFSDTQPRSVLNTRECGSHCLSHEEILGLATSVGIQKFSGALPFVQKETDKTLVIKHPFPKSDIHYVIIPKKDIKAVEGVSDEDAPSIIDAYAVMSSLIKEQNLRDYKIITNGPGFQTVGYLHFHLVSELPE